mgnify:CR=1 FL=1
MGGNLDVLDYHSYMKKFVWGDIEPFHCGAPPKVNHLDNPPRGIRMICLSCSH